MKILVPVKRTIDANIHVRIKQDGTDVDQNNVKMGINPFCEIAVEAAVQMKEAGMVEEIIVVTVGQKICEDVLRHGLAMGADRGILMETDQTLQPLGIARLLEQVVNNESPQLVILGKQSIDADNNQTGQMLAALLGWPQGTFASNIEVAGDRVKVTREVDSGLQTLSLKLPAIVTTDLRLNEPRYLSLPNIMKARKKPIDYIDVSELDIDVSSRTQTLKPEEPPKRSGGVKLASVKELVDKLRNEARVI
ncbi:MAG: electron transfer flavoprotein subunit beta/FixA family protein [Gammaproteobacteria bacterium]|nr:electron transfer flavoprotein subunit beta/FixA family protein [Gammaproteobacteria bacterium]